MISNSEKRIIYNALWVSCLIFMMEHLVFRPADWLFKEIISTGLMLIIFILFVVFAVFHSNAIKEENNKIYKAVSNDKK